MLLAEPEQVLRKLQFRVVPAGIALRCQHCRSRCPQMRSHCQLHPGFASTRRWDHQLAFSLLSWRLAGQRDSKKKKYTCCHRMIHNENQQKEIKGSFPVETHLGVSRIRGTQGRIVSGQGGPCTNGINRRVWLHGWAFQVCFSWNIRQLACFFCAHKSHRMEKMSDDFIFSWVTLCVL
jgi:hypothetical protein